MYSVLMVDDDALVLKSLMRLFRSHEYDIDYVNDANKALSRCAMKKYDLVISDQRMPAILGTELFEEIQRKYPWIRRILISGYADFNNVTDAFNNGTIHKFVLKPWSNCLLEKLVSDQLKSIDSNIVLSNYSGVQKQRITKDHIHAVNNRSYNEIDSCHIS